MKKLLLLILPFLFFNAKAQTITIPDAKFATYLQGVVPLAMFGNQLDTSNSSVKSLTSINVSNDSIHDLTGVQYFTSLNYLNCSNNLLTHLPNLPHTIRYLYCQKNSITGLPAFPSSAEIVNCGYNLLTALPYTITDSIYNFNCEHNLLTSLPPLPLTGGLAFLNCRNNNINSIPAPFPLGLQQLDCSYNNLTSLPSISYLQYLDCSYNNLNLLPTTPLYNTQYLYCTSNHLTSLPALPNTILNIDCGLNQITSLPALPNSLGALACYSNSLTSLPALPNSLQFLSCSNNNISCFPTFPNTLTDSMQFYINPNPYNCLPNYVPAMRVVDLAEPLCTAGNSNGCALAGIENINLKPKINIYPNPAQNNFTVEVSNNDKQTVQLFDVNGKLILTQTIIDKTTIDVSNLNSGVYNLGLLSSIGVVNKKLVIVK
jgi:hypothetical protein